MTVALARITMTDLYFSSLVTETTTAPLASLGVQLLAAKALTDLARKAQAKGAK
jgi:hypothetical protein